MGVRCWVFRECKRKPRRGETAAAKAGPENHSLNQEGSALRAEGTVAELGSAVWEFSKCGGAPQVTPS